MNEYKKVDYSFFFLIIILLVAGIVLIAVDLKSVKNRLGVLEQKMSSTASVAAETPAEETKASPSIRLDSPEGPSTTTMGYNLKSFKGGDEMVMAFTAENIVDGQKVKIVLPWGVREVVRLSKEDDYRTLTKKYKTPEVAFTSEGPVVVQLLSTDEKVLDQNQAFIQINP